MGVPSIVAESYGASFCFFAVPSSSTIDFCPWSRVLMLPFRHDDP
jgi:hypothetical protein